MTFFVSVRVPSAPEPFGASDRLTSQRIEPWSMRTSETPRDLTRSRSAVTYARASFGARAPVSGIIFVSMSICGTPAGKVLHSGLSPSSPYQPFCAAT